MIRLRGIHNNGTSRIGVLAGYAYLGITFLVFAFGWMKWYIALPVAICFILSFYLAARTAPTLWVPEFSRKNLLLLLAILAVILLWVWFSGIGGFSYQNSDHVYRNSTFELLVSESWPVYSMQGEQMQPLVYYIGFWLPSAVVGKLFGIGAGYAAQYIWAVLGVALIYYLICAVRKKLLLWPLLLLIAFGGLDFVGMLLTNVDLSAYTLTTHIEWWMGSVQFSSFTTQLYWVFNQTIPAWLIVLLLYLQKDNKSVVFLFSFGLLSCTLPAMGMLPFLIYFVFSRKYDTAADLKSRGKAWFKDTFTLTNLLGGGAVGITTALYVMSNQSGQKFSLSEWGFFEQSGSLYLLLVFYLVEFGLYAVCILKYQKKNPLFYIVLATLLAVPVLSIVGFGTDFGMRACIPAQLILYLLVVDTVQVAWQKRSKYLLLVLAVCLYIGSLSSMIEINRSLQPTFQELYQKNPLTGYQGEVTQMYVRRQNLGEPLNHPNFFGDSDSFFFSYIAK
ncbi:MAG: hypothetical protein ACK5MN_13485 [Lachnospiraceae bacterium]